MAIIVKISMCQLPGQRTRAPKKKKKTTRTSSVQRTNKQKEKKRQSPGEEGISSSNAHRSPDQ